MTSPPITERTDPLIGSNLVGRFVIRARLGAGGFGVVYRANQLSIDRSVAIKVLGLRASGPVARQRFQREAQVLSRLTSPHTVRLIDFGVLDDGRFFYVMEYLEGETLEDLIARGPIPVDVAMRIAEQICHALQEAHGKHVVHRDLKPANIWMQQVSGDRVVKLLDFGTARLLDSDAVTRSEVLIGTPAYLAPEQCRSGDLDGRADLYALGLVLFEMIAGRHPFGEGVLAEMVYRHVHAPPPELCEVAAGVPPMLSGLVRRLMAKSPDDRPESAWAVRLELERLMTDRGSSRVMGLAPTARYDAMPDATSPSLPAVGDATESHSISRQTRALDRRAVSQIVDMPLLDGAPTIPSLGPDFRAEVIAGLIRQPTGAPGHVPAASQETVSSELDFVRPRRRPWPLLLLLLGAGLGVVLAYALPTGEGGVEPDAGPIQVGMTPTAVSVDMTLVVDDDVRAADAAPHDTPDATADVRPAPAPYTPVDQGKRPPRPPPTPVDPPTGSVHTKPEPETGDIMNVIFD